MPRRVTVYDIAEATNLSASTVSRVLNNSRLIGDETRERVLRAAADLGYERRTIRRQRDRRIVTLKVLLPPATAPHVHLFYNLADLVGGLEAGFADVRVLVQTAVNDRSVATFHPKKGGDLDACVFAFCEPGADLARELDRRATPWVVLNRRPIEGNWVTYDDDAGMRSLVGALLSVRPSPRPCFVGLSSIPVSAIRADSTSHALATRGITLAPDAQFVVDDIAQIETTAIPHLEAGRFDSVICFNDVFAVYVYQAALRRGLLAGRDFSLTGYDNSPVQELVSVGIDTIELSTTRLGEEAGRWLRRCVIDRQAEPLALTLTGAYVPGETL